LLAATQHDLKQKVRDGSFRHDLYHRLNVVRVELPPLRERTGDIADLLAHYLGESARELGIEPKTLSQPALARLQTCQWPGNGAELVNLCMGLSVLAPATEITLEDLPPEAAELVAAARDSDWVAALSDWADRYAMDAKTPLLDEALPKFEKALIRAALK